MKTLRFIAATAAVAMLAACSGKEKTETEATAATADETPLVEVDVAVRQDVTQAKTYTANIEPYISNNISPQAPNRIKDIRVDVGDRVSRGQTLVTLDQSNINQLQIALDNAEREYKRALDLLEIGAGTQQAVDQLKTQYESYKTQYDNLLENTVLTSPCSGVVTARNYDPGDMSGAQPVLTIGEINKVKVMINVSENDYSSIRTGMPVEVTFDAFPGETFQGTIARIYPTVDRATRTFQAEVIVNNPELRILPGMFARVYVALGTQNHVVVPDKAIVKQSGSGNKYVYVYRDGKVSFNRVELGQRLGDKYELISGIEEGDSVVTTGQARLADGVAVELLVREAPAQ